MSEDQLQRLRKAWKTNRVFYLNYLTGMAHGVIDINCHGVIRIGNPDGVFGTLQANETPLRDFVKGRKI